MSEIKTVTVKALKFHTLHGEAHAQGSTYDVDETQVDNLIGQGMVVRLETPPPETKVKK